MCLLLYLFTFVIFIYICFIYLFIYCLLQEEIFLCLELLRLGLLSGDSLEMQQQNLLPSGVRAAIEQRYAGEEMKSSSSSSASSAAAAGAAAGAAGGAAGDRRRAALLLQRVASLLPLRLKPGVAWRADVCLDLFGFSTLVSLLRTSFKELTDAALVSRLLQEPHLVSTSHMLLYAAAAASCCCCCCCWLLAAAAAGCCCCCCWLLLLLLLLVAACWCCC